MANAPAKQALIDELVALVGAELENVERAYRATRAGATHEEAKPENDKDTRALEQTYLARGQAQRVRELTSALAELRGFTPRAFPEDGPIAMGALVHVEEEGAAQAMMLVLPQGGGHTLAGGTVQVVTPKSPLGRALIGKMTGEDCEVVVGGQKRELSVSLVR